MNNYHWLVPAIRYGYLEERMEGKFIHPVKADLFI